MAASMKLMITMCSAVFQRVSAPFGVGKRKWDGCQPPLSGPARVQPLRHADDLIREGLVRCGLEHDPGAPGDLADVDGVRPVELKVGSAL